ncbi:uncharacterized protein C10orf143 homolog [Phascolarctos cinereus]
MGPGARLLDRARLGCGTGDGAWSCGGKGEGGGASRGGGAQAQRAAASDHMERGALAGLRRRPVEEERGGLRDTKRARRSIEAGPGEDTDRGQNELLQGCWITDWGLESKGFIAQESLPGNIQGRQSSVISANNERRPTQPCSRCLAGESGY